VRCSLEQPLRFEFRNPARKLGTDVVFVLQIVIELNEDKVSEM
jgi:hypothetical protein